MSLRTLGARAVALLGAALCALPVAQAAEPTTKPLPRLETGMHTATIWRIATDAAGRWAVTASDDKTARVWDVATGQLVRVVRPPQDVGNEGELRAVAISPNGETIAVGGWTGWDWDGTNMKSGSDSHYSGRLRAFHPRSPPRWPACRATSSPACRCT